MYANKDKLVTLLKKDALLVDMRDAVTFRDFKIEGSVNLPSIRALNNYLLLEKNKSRPVILYSVNTDDDNLKSGLTYAENLGFETYVTDVRQLR